MARDTVRAFQHERRYLEALKVLPEGEREAVKAYVDSLLEAMKLVNRALSVHTAGGSEYWDERGSVYGSLLAVEHMADSARTWREAFLEERHKRGAVSD